jgi:hypothetical protein
MPTGLKNGIDAGGPGAGLVSSQPRKAINYTIRMLLAATGVPQRFPGIIIPEGLSVSLRGHNGGTGNAAAVCVGNHPEYANASSGRIITPDTEISFPVDHGAQIWATGTAGDGLIMSVSGVPIG